MSFLIILKDYLQIVKINYLDSMEIIKIKKFMSFADKQKKEFLTPNIIYLDETIYDKNIISCNNNNICEFLNRDNEEINEQELLRQYGSHELHEFLQKNSFFIRIKNIIKKLFK